GSGTTAAAALQMGRNYCGIDISEQYVENTRKRLDELKKQPKTPQGLSMHELLELKRLLFEISRPLEDYKTCEKLAEILCRQFAIRMNSDKPYDRETILPLLQDLNPWRGRK
ncbi:MAG TPA: DNA methyltransferase, partial [Anaerohalosphaeraceae bacterium]|nr:DNA methyltransferase [Anaerohalosphaeraceae bacterium]